MAAGRGICPGGLGDAVATGGATLPIDSAPVAIFVFAGDRIAGANASGLRLVGARDQQEVVGRLASELVVLGDPVSDIPDPAGIPDASGTAWRHAVVRPFTGTSVPVLIAHGEPWSDRCGDRRAMLVVPAVAGRAGQADVEPREKSRDRIAEVFANLAHEMRTPLNAVIGFGEIMLGEHFGPLAGRYRDYARDIVGAGYHLLALVNGALDLGRASAGAASLDERTVELGAVLASALAMLEPAAAGKSIALDVPDRAGLPLIYADETRMRQLLVNLLSNAIKYSPAGRSVVVRHRWAESGDVWLDVIDSGAGMSGEEIKIALLPFGRTESAIRSGEAGTGLGLPISKAIIEAHGGRLGIDSRPHAGTTVSIMLPANRVVAAPGHGGLLSLL